MTRSLILMVLALVAFLSSSAVQGQEKKSVRPPAKAVAKPTPNEPALVGVYTQCDTIESAYNEGTVKPKGEFETTAEYETRKKNAVSLMRERCFVFEPAFTRYDADAETYLFIINSTTYRGPTFIAKEIPEAVSTYEASNAFGAKMTVTKTHWTKYAFELTTANAPRFIDVLGNGLVKVAVPLERAKTIRSQNYTPKLVIKGFITAASYSKPDYQKPSFDKPQEAIIDYRIIPLEPTGLSLRVAETNEVLWTFTPAEAK